MLKWTITKTPKEWRKRKGYTQKEAAQALGISRQAYIQLEKGKAVPSFDTILRMNHIDKINYDMERYGDGYTYTTFKIGDLYEVEIEEG